MGGGYFSSSPAGSQPIRASISSAGCASAAARKEFWGAAGPLKGRRALITSGRRREPIAPVRFIANRSSGKQGHAIAAALAGLGADTTLVTGPTQQPNPPGVKVSRIET